MIVRQYAPCSLGRSIICLGKQGEINALRVEFDVSAWMAMYPDATVKLMHFAPDRPQDNPVIPTLGVEGTLRVWIVGEEDTANSGNGVIELLLIDERTGSTIKSATGYTTVLRSPSAGIEAQEAEAGYVRYDVDQSALLTDEQKAMARKTKIATWAALIGELRSAIDGITTNHAAWNTLEAGKPRIAHITQLRDIIDNM